MRQGAAPSVTKQRRNHRRAAWPRQNPRYEREDGTAVIHMDPSVAHISHGTPGYSKYEQSRYCPCAPQVPSWCMPCPLSKGLL